MCATPQLVRCFTHSLLFGVILHRLSDGVYKLLGAGSWGGGGGLVVAGRLIYDTDYFPKPAAPTLRQCWNNVIFVHNYAD